MRLLFGAMMTTLLAGCAFDEEYVDTANHPYYSQPNPNSSCAAPAPSPGLAPASYIQPIPAQTAEPPR